MFQFKMNHHILYTRAKLFKAKTTDSDSCHVWIEAEEHLFVEWYASMSTPSGTFYLLVERQ